MNKKRKAFTLVELLAVIVILAVILVIAIPQIMSVIKSTRISSIKDSAILIATNAEKDYLSNQVLDENYNKDSIPCADVAKLNADYSYCNVIYEDGKAKVLLNGKTNGKFSNMYCVGTKDDMECKEGILAVAYIKERAEKKLDGLIIDEYGNIRYQGGNDVVKNYVNFNNEVWRIIGVFDGKIKLIRNGDIGYFSWDSSESTINSGKGLNNWKESDLMKELNTDYLNTELTENPKWYNGENNKKELEFAKGKALKVNAQELIDDSIWYLGKSQYNISLKKQYDNERKNEETWVGKVGLIYASDFGYASKNANCASSLGYDNRSNCANQNWLCTSNRYWTINAALNSNSFATGMHGGNYIGDYVPSYLAGIRPVVYLKPEVKLIGLGTNDANKYVFSL